VPPTPAPGLPVPTKQQVLAALGGGTDYPAAAARLGIHPGLAYLIATGMPADGSDVPTPEDLERPGVLTTSTQHLANPAVSKPDAAEVVHAWLRRRAQGDPQMLAAARARTATPGPVQDPEGSTDVLDVLTRQHDAVTSLVKQLDTIPGRSKGGTPAQASERESIVDMVRQALAAHETSEEQVLWPRVREVLPDGDDWATGGRQQEEQATETLEALAGTDPQTEDFDEQVEKLMSQLHKHVTYEDRLFLQLREALDDDERAQLGERILAAQRTVPEGPHPRPADREGHPEPGLEC
jgi:hemerythrin-like domain-containing protein